jgi:hypothetical protein
MGLPEDIATIHAKIEAASAAAGDIQSTPVDLTDEINAINDQQVDFDPVIAALIAAADAIDGLSGDSSTLRLLVAAIQNQSIGFGAVKNALTAGESIMNSLSTNLDGAGGAVSPHVEASELMVSLLIDQSNFSGEEQ